MRGTLEAESTPGRGTTMRADLERAEAVQRFERAAEAAPPAELGERTLLYIEDNLSNLRLVERVLERFAEVRVIPAMQGKLGLELAREHRPDLVLLDLHLPDLPGREVLLRLKAEPALRETPVVIVSADATEGEIKRMLAAGACAYLTKPLDVRRFLEILEECLGEEEDLPW
jgi:CheY-like chemotaxis protein